MQNIASINRINTLPLIKIVSGIVFIAACAQVMIPMYPVPITLHTVAISLIGLFYSPREAITTTTLYLIIGILGAPIFKGFASGFTYAMGPTGGYLVGLIFAAAFISLSKNLFSDSKWSLLARITLGHTIIYMCGVMWLSSFVGLNSALYSGMIILLPTGIIKTIALTSIVYYLQRPAQ